MVASDMNYYVTSNEVKISIEDNNEYSKVYYSFIMPNKDVYVDIETKNDMTCLSIPEKEIIRDENKKYCQDCGLELDPNIKFCPECGCKNS